MDDAEIATHLRRIDGRPAVGEVWEDLKCGWSRRAVLRVSGTAVDVVSVTLAQPPYVAGSPLYVATDHYFTIPLELWNSIITAGKKKLIGKRRFRFVAKTCNG